MNIDEYKQAMIALFKSGKATDEQWAELAAIILRASENGVDAIDATDAIDTVILGPVYECAQCGTLYRPAGGDPCPDCGLRCPKVKE